SGNDTAIAIAAAPGGAFVVGNHEGPITLGSTTFQTNGKTDMFVAELAEGGQVTRAASYGSTDADWVHGVAAAPDGNLVFAGTFQNTLNLGVPTPLVSAGGYDVFVSKLAPGSNTPADVWGINAGNSTYQAARAVAVDAKGDVVVAGEFAGTLGPIFPALQSKG